MESNKDIKIAAGIVCSLRWASYSHVISSALPSDDCGHNKWKAHVFNKHESRRESYKQKLSGRNEIKHLNAVIH